MMSELQKKTGKILVIVRHEKSNKLIQSIMLDSGTTFQVPKDYIITKQEMKAIHTIWVKKI